MTVYLVFRDPDDIDQRPEIVAAMTSEEEAARLVTAYATVTGVSEAAFHINLVDVHDTAAQAVGIA